MRHIKLMGVALIAVLAMSAILAVNASAAEYGQCRELTKNTLPKAKHGKYEDAACLHRSHKLKKGEEVLEEKGNFEWRAGAPVNCEEVKAGKGAYEDSACTKLHTKLKKGVPVPDHKGNFEQQPCSPNCA